MPSEKAIDTVTVDQNNVGIGLAADNGSTSLIGNRLQFVKETTALKIR